MLPDLTERLKIHADDSRATPERVSLWVVRISTYFTRLSSPGKVLRLLTN